MRLWLFLASVLWLLPAQAGARNACLTHDAVAITYPYESSRIVKLKPTARIPEAEGKVRVERKEGATTLHVELDDMKPATFFGGDFNTYVFWAVSPEGLTQNLGQFVLDGDEGSLRTSTKLITFALIVTAEPHYLVETPSSFVVLQNSSDVSGIKGGQISNVHYESCKDYRYDRETLAGMSEARGHVRTGVGQAWAAVRLARQVNAEEFAPQELQRAEQALNKTVSMAQGGDKREVENQAHEAVRLAVAAQNLAEYRAQQAALEAERRAYRDKLDRLEKQIREATDQKEKARLEAERRQLQLQMEQEARLQAQQRALEAERRASQTSEELSSARQRTQELQQAEAEARARAAQAIEAAEAAKRSEEEARREQQATLDRMQQALNQIAETQQTARGLIVNIPDVLFDFDRSTLRPEGRERLSKIAGIVLASGTVWIFAIEGHTDNVGSDDYNQRLSEQRAQTVAAYLTGSGVPHGAITAVTGFGESRPIASNDTSSGRQRNRRVEILIQRPQQPLSE